MSGAASASLYRLTFCLNCVPRIPLLYTDVCLEVDLVIFARAYLTPSHFTLLKLLYIFFPRLKKRFITPSFG